MHAYTLYTRPHAFYTIEHLCIRAQPRAASSHPAALARICPTQSYPLPHALISNEQAFMDVDDTFLRLSMSSRPILEKKSGSGNESPSLGVCLP
eukprot:1316700-Amorphochlora_amoeboformis.AAC.1